MASPSPQSHSSPHNPFQPETNRCFEQDLDIIHRSEPQENAALKLAEILQDQPSLQTRTSVVNLLRTTLSKVKNKPMISSTLMQLKKPLLHSLKMESEEIVFPSLWKLMGEVSYGLYQYSPCGLDDELLQYSITCISDKLKSNIKKGLSILTDFCAGLGHQKEFWWNYRRFDAVFKNVMDLAYSDDNESKTLAFNACKSLFVILWKLINEDPEEVWEDKLKYLGELVTLDNGNIFNEILSDMFQYMISIADKKNPSAELKYLGELVTLDNVKNFKEIHSDMFQRMISIADRENASEELIFEAVNIVVQLRKKNLMAMKGVIRQLDPEGMRKVVTVALKTMVCMDADQPLFCDIFTTVVFTKNLKLGQFLLYGLCSDVDDVGFVDIIRTYAKDDRWQFRNAAVFCLAAIAEKNLFNGMGMINQFDGAASVLLSLLDDNNNIVTWATMDAIKHLTGHRHSMDRKPSRVRPPYQVEFMSKLRGIATRHSCPRVQLYATMLLRILDHDYMEIPFEFRLKHHYLDQTFHILERNIKKQRIGCLSNYARARLTEAERDKILRDEEPVKSDEEPVESDEEPVEN